MTEDVATVGREWLPRLAAEGVLGVRLTVTPAGGGPADERFVPLTGENFDRDVAEVFGLTGGEILKFEAVRAKPPADPPRSVVIADLGGDRGA